jgi:hypothetical protein
MNILKTALLTLAATIVMANAAFAHVASTSSFGHGREVTTDIGSPAHSISVIDLGTTIIYKQLIIAAEKPAVDVLNGGNATDLFVQAREAIEQRNGVSFETDQDAADAIIEEANRI